MKSQKVYIIVILCAAIVSAVIYVKSSLEDKKQSPLVEDVHYHAGFKVFKNDEQLDFTGFNFMNVKPCNTDEEDDHDEDDDFIHLHDSIGDVIHIHGPGVTWGKVFENLSVHEESVRAFIGGEEVSDPLSRPVEGYESVIFLIGENPHIDPHDADLYVTRERIDEVEATIESCGN